MAYQLQAVARKKRRSGAKAKELQHATRINEVWLESPLTEEQSFSNLPPHIRAGLQAIALPIKYSRGSVLFFEGEKPSGVFVVSRGRVKLSASSSDGRCLLVRRADAGEMVGLPGAVSGKPNEVTAEAVDEVECNFIPREAFLGFLRNHGDAALRMAEALTEIYQSILHQVRCLGLSTSTAEKLARFLLDLPAERAESIAQVPLTHKEIAGMIGSSRETVTRMFARFKREQLVEINDGGFRITNRAALEQILAG